MSPTYLTVGLRYKSTKVDVFWDVTLWVLVDMYRRLGRTYCLYLQGPSSPREHFSLKMKPQRFPKTQVTVYQFTRGKIPGGFSLHHCHRKDVQPCTVNICSNISSQLCTAVAIVYDLTHCGRVTQICVFNTVKLSTSASSPQCHSTRGNFSRGITPSSTTRVFGEYFLKISVHKNSQRICYKFLKKHSIKVD